MANCRSIVVVLCLLLVATVQPAEAAADGLDPIVVKGPHYGEVLFYFYQEDYFPAIVRLLAAQKQSQLSELTEQAELLLVFSSRCVSHYLLPFSSILIIIQKKTPLVPCPYLYVGQR